MRPAASQRGGGGESSRRAKRAVALPGGTAPRFSSRSGARCLVFSPGDERRQAHEDRLDVSAAAQPEQRPPIVEQVEFHVAAAPAQLLRAIVLRVPHVGAPLDEGCVGGKECVAYVA